MKVILKNLSKQLQIMLLTYLPSSSIASIHFNHKISGIFHFFIVLAQITNEPICFSKTCLYLLRLDSIAIVSFSFLVVGNHRIFGETKIVFFGSLHTCAVGNVARE